MPIIGLQQRFAEVGRIRIGKKSAKGFPEKIDTFRFTSQSRPAVEAVAELYGGEVALWKPDAKSAQQFQVITPAKDLSVTVAPGQTLSQWFEWWKSSKCERRCDGVTEMISGTPCKCPFDDEERRSLAAKGQACKPTTRLSVMLEGVPVIGLWRVESHGFYAATELGAMSKILEYATAAGVYVPATLRLQERPGPKGRIFVPVLELSTTIAALKAALSLPELGSGSPAVAALPAAPSAGFVDRQTGRIHVPAADVFEPATGRLVEDVPSFDDLPLPGEEGHPEAAGPRPIVEGDDDVVEAEIVEEISVLPAPAPEASPSEPVEPESAVAVEAATPLGDGAFSQGLMISARKAELDDDTRHAIILKVTGGRTSSTKDVTASESTELHNTFALIRMGKVALSFSPDGEISWS